MCLILDFAFSSVNFNPPTSEDSDTTAPDPDSPYSGYEQLTFDGETFIAATPSDADSDNDEEEDVIPTATPITYPSDFAEIECSGGSNGFPDVVPVDVEIAQQIWNAPAEPSRANTIELDDTRTNQIISLMSGISLPQNCIPEWAQQLSEDNWKQELLDKIRKGGDQQGSTNTKDDNQ